MTPKVLHRRWQRRLVTLDKRIQALFQECRKTGGAETIHDLRVAIRRARLYAQIGRPLLQKRAARRFDDWARTVNKALGPVRDHDVCMNWLATRSDTADAIQSVHEERLRLWIHARSRLTQDRSDWNRGVVFRAHLREHVQKLSARYRKELRKLTRVVAEAVPRIRRMKPQELHDLRRRLRRWRYLRELALSKRDLVRDPVLNWLVEVQDALGESQNLEMAMGLLDAHPEWDRCARLASRARTQQARWVGKARRRLVQIPPALFED